MSTTATAAAIARRLAAKSPDATLPCPACAASVKAQNLERHLAKVHPGLAGPEAGALAWTGADRALLPLAFVPLGATVLAMGALALTHTTTGAPLAVALATAVLLSLGLLLLVLTDRLPARLAIDGDRVRLRYALGLLGRELTLPAQLEVGSRLERRPSGVRTASADMNERYEDVRAGSYLRLDDGRRSITVGARGGTRFRKHWDPAGWRSGPKRRTWDITLEPTEMVALEYLLAARGLLAPRRT